MSAAMSARAARTQSFREILAAIAQLNRDVEVAAARPDGEATVAAARATIAELEQRLIQIDQGLLDEPVDNSLDTMLQEIADDLDEADEADDELEELYDQEEQENFAPPEGWTGIPPPAPMDFGMFPSTIPGGRHGDAYGLTDTYGRRDILSMTSRRAPAPEETPTRPLTRADYAYSQASSDDEMEVAQPAQPQEDPLMFSADLYEWARDNRHTEPGRGLWLMAQSIDRFVLGYTPEEDVPAPTVASRQPRPATQRPAFMAPSVPLRFSYRMQPSRLMPSNALSRLSPFSSATYNAPAHLNPFSGTTDDLSARAAAVARRNANPMIGQLARDHAAFEGEWDSEEDVLPSGSADQFGRRRQ